MWYDVYALLLLKVILIKIQLELNFCISLFRKKEKYFQ